MAMASSGEGGAPVPPPSDLPAPPVPPRTSVTDGRPRGASKARPPPPSYPIPKVGVFMGCILGCLSHHS